MKVGLLALGPLLTATVGAQPIGTATKVGETYSITLDRRTETISSDGSSSGSSTDIDTIIEHVLAVNGNGAEVEFDWPSEATPEERAAVWQLPARVFLPSNGTPRLLNEAALEARVDPWLHAANWTRAECGKGIFTWNYFVIECDPQSALRLIERFHPAIGNISANAAYHAPGAKGSTPLRTQPSTEGSIVLTAVLPLDVDLIRRERAQAAVKVAALIGKAMTADAAMQEQRKKEIGGTVETTFQLDRTGSLNRRVTITRVTTAKVSRVTETQTITEVLSRRCIARCS